MLHAAWDIHFWPTDAEDYYLDSAEQLIQARFVSDIHHDIDEERVRLAHGKEIFFLCISFFQRLLRDVETLRPIIIVCILSLLVSSLLVYQILKSFWGTVHAFIGWFLFAFSAWPYMYILMAKHQPAGLMFFLGAVFFIMQARGSVLKKFIFGLLAGLWLGLSFFASTVSALYWPYFAAAWVYGLWTDSRPKDRAGRLRSAGISMFLVAAGFFSVVVYINLPDIGENLRSYWEYVRISGRYNHFFYNQPFLQQWFETTPVASVRGGWLWIVRYFAVIMPVLFPFYILCAVYLLSKVIGIKDIRSRLKIAGVLFLSLSACLMAESVGAAQYGANYFPALVGLIVLIVFCLDDISRHGFFFTLKAIDPKRGWRNLLVAVLTVHALVNAFMFWGDIYPCRMSKNYLSDKIRELNPKRISTFVHLRHYKAFIPYLDEDIKTGLPWTQIQTLAQAREGLILLPPITGNSIYIAVTSPYIHFDRDLFLNALIESGQMEDYAVASYRTLANSRYWLHEEEILTYRRLILGHTFGDNRLLGRIWLLDAERLSQSLTKFAPRGEDLNLMREDARRIGTRNRFLLSTGTMIFLKTKLELNQVVVSLRKVGNPRDSLRAYLYKIDDRQPVWVPASEKFYSTPMLAVEIKSREEMSRMAFRFDPSVTLQPGRHLVIVHRTGRPDDQNYYIIGRKDIDLEQDQE